MAIVSLSGQSLTRESLQGAVRALDRGAVVAVPTDTGYALVSDVSYTGSADRLFALTQRTRDFALSLLVSDVEQAMSVADGVTPVAEQIMAKLWPGALTLVLPRDPELVADLGDDEETVGVRIPDHVIPRLLCDEVGPLATVGAGLRGVSAATTAQQVEAMFGDRVAIVLDDGEHEAHASTVVDVTGTEPKLIREGSLPWSEVTHLSD